MRSHICLCVIHCFFGFTQADTAASCDYPGSPRHGKLYGWVAGFPNSSFARFSCLPGYILLGPSDEPMQCINGRWTKGIPLCVRDVARGKPVNQSEPITMDFTSELVVDGEDFTCTKPANHWTVTLFESTAIYVVKLVFGEDLPRGKVSVRLGDTPEMTDNHDSTSGLCGEFSLEIKKYSPYFVVCDESLNRGRYLSVHVHPETGAVPLCVIEAHTLSGLSHEDACPTGHKDTIKDTFNGYCFEFHIMDPASFSDARSVCSKTNGRLIGAAHNDEHTLSYLRWRTGTLFNGRAFWLDINETQAKLVSNAQLSTESSSGDCYTLSSKNSLTRSECQSLNHVICMYNALTCGRPRLPKAFHDWQIIDKLKPGRTIKNIRCSEGFYPDPDNYLACDSRGEISGSAHCREFVCGKQPSVKDGASWATSSDSVQYSCNGGKLIKGEARVVCNSTTRLWSKAPVCRTILQAMKEWVQSTESRIEEDIDQKYRKFREFPRAEKIAILCGVMLLLMLVAVGIARGVYLRRKRKRFEVGRLIHTRGVRKTLKRRRENDHALRNTPVIRDALRLPRRVPEFNILPPTP